MTEERFLIVVPLSFHPQFLKVAHDQVGHQGAECRLLHSLQITYWVGMSKDVSWYCFVCSKCKYTKTPRAQPAPLQPVRASRPREIVAVDIVKVPMSSSQQVNPGLFLKVAVCLSHA